MNHLMLCQCLLHVINAVRDVENVEQHGIKGVHLQVEAE